MKGGNKDLHNNKHGLNQIYSEKEETPYTTLRLLSINVNVLHLFVELRRIVESRFNLDG